MASENEPPEQGAIHLTAEAIEAFTDYSLAVDFPEVKNEPDGTLHLRAADLHQLRNALADMGGDRNLNVLPSFYSAEDGTVRLGIFIRPLGKQPLVHEIEEAQRTLVPQQGRPHLRLLPQLGEAALGPETSPPTA